MRFWIENIEWHPSPIVSPTFRLFEQIQKLVLGKSGGHAPPLPVATQLNNVQWLS